MYTCYYCGVEFDSDPVISTWSHLEDCEFCSVTCCHLSEGHERDELHALEVAGLLDGCTADDFEDFPEEE